MASMRLSIEPFNKLVKLTARAFYDDITTKGDNLPKTRSDNRGIAVIILDALTRRQWVREEDLAKDLKIHTKQLRRTLRFFEEEKLIMRDHRKETAKGVKLHAAAVAATADSHPYKEGEDKIKLHTHSYCCLDYAQLFLLFIRGLLGVLQIYDVVRYRIHRMKKKLKDELESKNTIQEYICPNCSKRYTALDAARLVSMEDEYFHCESCNGELEAESDKLANQDVGDGDDNARKRRQNKLRVLLQNTEAQLKPLMEQIARVKDLQIPDFGSLQTWEASASAAARANLNNDGSRSSQGLAGTPMPYLGETKVEVAFSGGLANDGDSKSGIANEPMKVLPPWMIKQGMNLTGEQRGDMKQESKMDGSSLSSEPSDDKKSAVGKDGSQSSLQDEYIKAYYAALYQRQREQEEAAKRQLNDSSNDTNTLNDSSPNRQVGIKSKRKEDDNDEWEDDTPAGNASARKIYKVDLNLEAEATTPSNYEEDDDDVEWEEG
ncbi:hypothetical protein V2J09_010161 [Rumex salicifolius]